MARRDDFLESDPIIVEPGPHVFAITAVDELIRHPAILAAVSRLLGPDLMVWDSDIIIKNPATPTGPTSTRWPAPST